MWSLLTPSLWVTCQPSTKGAEPSHGIWGVGRQTLLEANLDNVQHNKEHCVSGMMLLWALKKRTNQPANQPKNPLCLQLKCAHGFYPAAMFSEMNLPPPFLPHLLEKTSCLSLSHCTTRSNLPVALASTHFWEINLSKNACSSLSTW